MTQKIFVSSAYISTGLDTINGISMKCQCKAHYMNIDKHPRLKYKEQWNVRKSNPSIAMAISFLHIYIHTTVNNIIRSM